MLLVAGVLLRRGRPHLTWLRSRRALLSGMDRMLRVDLLGMWWWLAHRRRRGLLGLLARMRVMLRMDICRETLVREVRGWRGVVWRGRDRWPRLLLRCCLSRCCCRCCLLCRRGLLLRCRVLLLLLHGGLLSRELLLLLLLLLDLHPLLRLHLRGLLRRHGDLLLLGRHHLLLLLLLVRRAAHRGIAECAIGREGGIWMGIRLGHLDGDRLPRYAGLLHRVVRVRVGRMRMMRLM